MNTHLKAITITSLLLILSLATLTTVHAAPGPDFQVSSSPSSFIIHQGSSNTTSIITTSINNYSGSLTLSVGALPAGYSATWIPANMVTLTANQTIATTLKLTVTPTTQLRTSAITVTAANSTISRFTILFVTVVPPPQYDLSVNVNPGTINLVPGQSHDTTVTVSSVNGFNGTVALTATVAPSGLTLSFSLTNITVTPTSPGVSTLTITMPTTTTNGAYSVTIYATGGGVTRSGSVTINPPATLSPVFALTLQLGLYLIVAVAIIAVVAAIVHHGRRSPRC